MCGISGVINVKHLPVSKEIIANMNELVKHRGPDGEGYYFGESFAFGHRRLAIIDLTEDGSQPMSYMEKYFITYNGEIYNFTSLKEELIKEKYIFKSHTDTEVILAAYDKWGERCVHHFNGMWAFAIYDKEKNIIFCSRDHFGIKPFYYTNIGSYFLFGSEIKQFTAVEDWESKANKKRVMDFLAFGILDHTNETFFEGVYQLPSGNNLVYDLNSMEFKIEKYYDIKSSIKAKEKHPNNLTEEELVIKFEELFVNSIDLRLKSDVKLGSCLSGGLDSSSIVCVVRNLLKDKFANSKQETVSACFSISKYDEQVYIDKVLEKTKNTAYKVFPEFDELFEDLDKICWHQDEPFASTSIFSQWCVFKKAKSEEIKVMLDGQGADEQLAGYHGFYGFYLSELIRRFCFVEFYKEINAIGETHGYTKKKLLFETTKLLIPDWLKKIVKVKNHWKVHDWMKITDVYYKEYLHNLYKGKIKTLQDYSIDLIQYNSVPMLLHYEDRNSMAHSVESRVPFLDYRLVEFTLELPAKYKINKGSTKYILREAMKGILPEKIRNRNDKMGFVTPEEIWIRNNSELFKTELKKACENLKELIDGEVLLRWYDTVISGDEPINFTIWRVISLSRWMDTFHVKL